MRSPVAVKIALAIAAEFGGKAGSPRPVGALLDFRQATSIGGFRASSPTVLCSRLSTIPYFRRAVTVAVRVLRITEAMTTEEMTYSDPSADEALTDAEDQYLVQCVQLGSKRR